jgi:hypothetical protein
LEATVRALDTSPFSTSSPGPLGAYSEFPKIEWATGDVERIGGCPCTILFLTIASPPSSWMATSLVRK